MDSPMHSEPAVVNVTFNKTAPRTPITITKTDSMLSFDDETSPYEYEKEYRRPIEPISPSVSKHYQKSKQKSQIVQFTHPPFPRKVRFENYESDDEEHYHPLKVSVILFGVPILTEREADFQLSQRVEKWKKVLFLLSNLPYVMLALSSLFLNRIEHRSVAPVFDNACSSTFLHSLLIFTVSVTSVLLHSSQLRVGNLCCSAPKARTFHRRRVQDRLDVADCFCASLSVILGIVCHGVKEMGSQLVLIVPIFVLSIIVKKLKFWNLYLLVHGLWHLATAYILLEIMIPYHSVIRSLLP